MIEYHWARAAKPGLVYCLHMCISAVPMMALFWLSLFFVPCNTCVAGNKPQGVDNALFQKYAKLIGDPVVEIELCEESFVNDDFLVNLRNYPKLKKVALMYVPITDRGLRHLREIPELRFLYLLGLDNDRGGKGITDQGLENIKTLTKIERFGLAYATASDKGLAHLKDWKELKELYIAFTPITDRGMATIARFSMLEELSLKKTEITEAGLAGLKKMKALRVLRIPEVATDASLCHLTELTGLVELDLDNSLVTDKGLDHLKGLTQLRKISLRGTKVTGTGIRSIPNGVEELHLSRAPVSDKTLEQIETLGSLRILVLSDTKFTDDGLRNLSKLERLEYLNLFDCDGITDNGMQLISKMKNLRKLVISRTMVTDSGLAYIHQMTQLKELDHVSRKTTRQGFEKLQKALPDLKIRCLYW